MKILEIVLTILSSFGDVLLSCLLYYISLRPLRKDVSYRLLLILLAINFFPTIILSFTSIPYIFKSLVAFAIDVVTCYILSNHRKGLAIGLPVIYFILLYLCESMVPLTLSIFYPSVLESGVAHTAFLQVYGTLVSRGLLYLLLGGAISFFYRNKRSLNTQYLRAPQWICFCAGNTLIVCFMVAFSHALNDAPERMGRIAFILPIMFVIISGMYLGMLVSLSHESEGRYKLQSDLLRAEQRAEQSKTISSVYRQARGLRHDLSNHFQVIGSLATKGQTKEILAYLCQLEKSAPYAFGQWMETGDATVDAVLNAKFSRALQSGIRVHAEVGYPQPLDIPTADICTILFNMLDNAIEACEKNEDPQKRAIRLFMWQESNFFAITCKNPSEIQPIKDKRTGFRSSKNGSLHGIGMKQLEELATKYNGVFGARYKNGDFTAKVMLAHKPVKNQLVSTVDLPRGSVIKGRGTDKTDEDA